MIRATLDIYTKHLRANGKTYCAYCGKEINPDIEIDHGETTEYYHCHCEDALKEIEIKQKIKEIEQRISAYEAEMNHLTLSLPRPKYTTTTKTMIKLIKI